MITYPLDFPNIPIALTDYELVNVQSVDSSGMANRRFVNHFYQTLRVTLTLPPLRQDQALEMMGFLADLRGRAGTFKFLPPDFKVRGENPVSTLLVMYTVVDPATLEIYWKDTNYNTLILPNELYRITQNSQLIFSRSKILWNAPVGTRFHVSPDITGLEIGSQITLNQTDVYGIFRLAESNLTATFDQLKNGTFSFEIEAD